MKKFIATMLLAATAIAAHAQTPPKFKWIVLATSQDKTTVYSAANETIQIAKNDANIDVVLTLGKVTHNKQTEMFEWYVTIADCQRGFGTLRYLDTNGTWKFNVEYANDSHTLASDTAEQMCKWALAEAAPAAKPSGSKSTGTV